MGSRRGTSLKFWTPGGSSTPLPTAEHLDIPLDYEGVVGAGSLLGTKALQIFDETVCPVRAMLRWTEFYKHACGRQASCCEGTGGWRTPPGAAGGRLRVARRTSRPCWTGATTSPAGRSSCALAYVPPTAPITSSIQHFKDEWIAIFTNGGCPFDPMASTVFATAGASA